MSIEILLPFHGDPTYLRQTVESVLAQTDPAWRLTLLDDHYPDPAPADWVRGLGDTRIVVSRNERTLGANASYRKLLAASTGEHVVVLGADDRLLPRYVESMRELVRAHPDARVVQPGVRVIDEHGREVAGLADRMKSALRRGPAGRRCLEGCDAASSLLVGNWTYFPSLLWHGPTIRRIGFRGYDVVQDLALLIDVIVDGGALVVGDEPTFEYRRHAASDSSVRALSGSRFAEERAYFRTIGSELRQHGWPRAARAARWRLTSRAHALSLVPRTLSRGDLHGTASLVRHAVGS